MSRLEILEQMWKRTSSQERIELLRALSESIAGFDLSGWGGTSFEGLAATEHYDDLPSDLRGRLIMAADGDRFSVERNRKTSEALESLATERLGSE